MSNKWQCSEKIKDYKSAFHCFKEKFLEDKRSIFRLEDDDKILDKDSIQYLINNYIKKGFSGDASFIDKIKKQLIEYEPVNVSEVVTKSYFIFSHQATFLKKICSSWIEINT